MNTCAYCPNPATSASVDLAARICEPCARAFDAWADANPGRPFDEWAPVAPLARPISSTAGLASLRAGLTCRRLTAPPLVDLAEVACDGDRRTAEHAVHVYADRYLRVITHADGPPTVHVA